MRTEGRACFAGAAWALLTFLPVAPAQTSAWEGTVTLPTYTWEDDINPQFWALAGSAKDAAAPLSAIIYPYTMQDHLSRTTLDRTYKALFLENEYLKVICLPELGGRLHSVLDKTTGQETFHVNHVIKPSMIAMRGAWISGGVEWNAGPQGHTVTCVSPVDALVGQNSDGSVYLEVANLEKSQRTRWTARVTLHPGRAYLDEHIRLFNPADAFSPYYFWNCTAFPNRLGTRFVFPMTLGTDHSAVKFFTWPIHEGRDLSWLKNHETWASIFARECVFGFFGAYDVDADRGVVQVANHHQLSGKKAWTWGNWDFGLVSQKNLTDDDGPYIEVQSGPLPTQSDYGALWPRDEVAWQESWYPVHGLGDGFEFATRDVALQTNRTGGQLEVRIIATADFPGARCTLRQGGQVRLEQPVELSPAGARAVVLPSGGESAVEIAVTARDGRTLAAFTSPLAVPRVDPPAPAPPVEQADEERAVEELVLRGRKHDLATQRGQARADYEQALELDPSCAAACRGLGVLAVEAGEFESALAHLTRGLARDPSDGRSWYFLGVCHLKLDDASEALRCAARATRCFGTVALGHDLAGRAHMERGELEEARAAFEAAVRADGRDSRAADHLLIARYALRDPDVWDDALQSIDAAPTELVPRAVLALRNDEQSRAFARAARDFVGELEYELIDLGLTFSDLGLNVEAVRLVRAVCVDGVPDDHLSPLVHYHLAYWAARAGHRDAARQYLHAGSRCRDFEFASHPESVPVLRYAVAEQPEDAFAHCHLGNLKAHLGALQEAAEHWQQAVKLSPHLSIAFRNLGLYSRTVDQDLAQAVAWYRQALAARPTDQTLYRDLASVLIEDGKRPEAIRVLESTPGDKPRRADVTLHLAQAYLDEQRYDDVLRLFETTQYFVAWEGQTATWVIYSAAHVERGQRRFEAGDFAAALRDFDAALAYPENLGVGRSNQPEEAAALFWRGQALQELGRGDEARAAWRQGATGPDGSPKQSDYRQRCGAALSEPQQENEEMK